MATPTDEKLLRDFVAGDTATFELLVRRHAGELFTFVRRLVGNSMMAEDVVQECLLSVYLHAASFDRTRKFRPWLFAIAANKARDAVRKSERSREFSFDAIVEDGGENERRFLQLLSTNEPPVDETLSLDERRKLVRRAVEAMPHQHREVLVLAYFHRFAYKEIAEIVGIQFATVKSRLHAALTHFAKHYREAVYDRMNREP